MEEHAQFALPEINVGVLADAGTIKLRRRIPYHVAVEFLMTGRWMDAAEAKHWGLANHVVPKGAGMEKAREIAAQLAAGPPLLFPAIKQLLRHTEMVPEHEAFELHDALDAVQRVIRSEDLKEGARAFSREAQPALERPALAAQRTQQAARDDVTLHLAGAVPDSLDARVAPDALERQVAHQPHAAVNLQRLVGHHGQHFRGLELGDRHIHIGSDALIALPGRLEDQAAPRRAIPPPCRPA